MKLSATRILSSTVVRRAAALQALLIASVFGRQEPTHALVGRSVILFHEHGYGFDYFKSPVIEKPLLVKISLSDAETYDVFSGGLRLSDPCQFQWNLAGEGMFLTLPDMRIGPPNIGIARIPLGALMKPIPPSAWAFDEEKVPAEWKKHPADNLTDIGFGAIKPYYLIKSGFAWDEIGERGNLLKQKIDNEKIYFDIIAVSVSKLRLYFTFGSDLSIWETDGEKWELVKDHAATIEGPFLVLDQGRSALVQRDGKWGLLTPLGGDSPQFAPLVEREGDEPIRVVEDRDAGVNYFIYKGDILDAQGRVLDRVPPGLNSEERLIHLTRFALARREPK